MHRLETLQRIVAEDVSLKVCTKTIMDTTDSKITFDTEGISDYYHNFHKNILPNWHTDERGRLRLEQIADTIKKKGRGKDHDCIIGMSGGVDSSYVVNMAYELGLRPLVLHVDAGWNTQLATNNIERLVDGLNLDLHTEVINWQEMKDLQLAFLKSGVPDCDIPQDLAFFASLYKFAADNKINYILTGANFSTECVREPIEWGSYYATDTKYVRDVYKHFGNNKLRSFPLVDIFTYKLSYRYLKGIQVVAPLNYIPYLKNEAVEELKTKYGWQPYAHKHHESRFTRFFECYWLPKKFGFDKRKAHFSSLILTGQMTRDEALDRISRPEIDEQTMHEDFEYVAKKLGITTAALQNIFDAPNRNFTQFKNNKKWIDLSKNFLQLIGVERRMFR